MVDANNAINVFNNKTRLHRYKLPLMTKPTGGGITSIDLPRVGLLQGVMLQIAITVSGTVSAANALGVASVLNRVRLITNASVELASFSGAGYTYLINEQIGTELALAQGTTLNQGGTAVTATTFKLNVYIPVAMNRRDVTGLFQLQSEQQSVSLQITWESDSVVGGTATYTATCQGYLDFFTIPFENNKAILPPLRYIHQIIEDSQAVSAASDVSYSPLRGNIYLSVFHGLSLAQSAADSASRLRVIVGGSDVWLDMDVAAMDAYYYLVRGRTRRAGVYPVDYMASSELGTLGLPRDYFDTGNTTDYQHILTATGSGTLTTVRRMLIPLPAAS